MDESWNQRMDRFWATTNAKDYGQLRTELEELLTGLNRDDPRVLFEIASLHDYLGEEEQAVQPYREALRVGLSGQKREEALIQLASTLRNLGEFEQAISLLEQIRPDSALYIDAQGFLALALYDGGLASDALRVAVTALAPQTSLYGTALRSYAQDIPVPGIGAQS